MRPWLLLVVLLAVPCRAAAEADAVDGLVAWSRAAAPAPRVGLAGFTVPPALRQVSLSPAGDSVAWLGRDGRGAWVGVLDPAGGEEREQAVVESVERIAWSADGRGLLLFTPERVGFLPLAGRPGFFARLPPGRELEVLGADPVVPAAVLVAEETDDGEHRLLRWRRGGGEERLLSRGHRIAAFTLDGRGRPAYAQLVEGAERVLYRLPARGGAAGTELLRCGFRDACSLLAATADGATVYLRGRIGHDRWALFALDAASGGLELLHDDPRALADLEDVRLDPRDRRPLLAAYHTERRRTYAVDPALAADLGRVEAGLPGRDLDVEATRGGRFWLVREEGARLQHPRHHVRDRARRELRPILERQRARAAGVPEAALAERRHFDYRASDGRTVHGFLTLPRGADPAASPLVVLVHGGPWNHERSGFRGVPQFLAHRGYAVFEPNFRASSGYGFEYMRAGRGEFGDGRVHRDLVDGVEHLLARGIGDRRRVAVVGHSFGGFSALNAVIVSPRTFRAAVASAPAIDLVRALRDLEGEDAEVGGLPLDAVMGELLVDLGDPAAVLALQRRSPEANLRRTARPLLVLAGGRDEKIQLADVEHYVAALAEAGKDVSLVVDPAAGHGIEGPLARRALLFLLERFLGRHLGMPSPSRPDPLLAAHLARTVRMAPPGFAASLAAASAERPVDLRHGDGVDRAVEEQRRGE